MPNRRYRLPPVGFIQGFEAAARNLRFAKGGEELLITQSAVSRQVKALEDPLGVTLFERRQRALALTESGHALYRVATDVLERLQAATDQLRASGSSRQLSLTTTTGFASLWLIPRLQRFTSLHPDVDVRISATTTVINLERSLVDLAIRYCRPEDVPERAIRLFGEEVVVVCGRSLLRDRLRPLKRPHDLKHHVLLHFDYAGAQFLDWGTWLTSLGIGDLRPAGALHFSQYEQMIQPAISGQGVALVRQPPIADLIQSRALVAPFRKSLLGSRAYFIIESEHGAAKPHGRHFAAWLVEEAKGTPPPERLPNSG